MPFTPLQQQSGTQTQSGFRPLKQQPTGIQPGENIAQYLQRTGTQPTTQAYQQRPGVRGQDWQPLGVLTGAGKGLLSSISGGSQLVQRGAAALLKPFGVPTQQLAEKPAGISEALQASGMPQQQAQAAITPQTPFEQIGFTGEQILEYLAPGMAATKVGAAAKVPQWLAKTLAQAPKAAKFASKAVPIAAESVAEAALTGGVAAAQEGKVGLETGAAALAGALGPLVNLAGKKISGRVVNSLIKPSKRGFSFGKDPGAAIAREKISATTMPRLLKKIVTKRQGIGKQLETQLGKVKGKFANAENIIEKSTREFRESVTDPTAAQAFQNAMDQLKYETDLVEGKLIRKGTKDLTKMTPLELHKLQRKVGKLTGWTDQAYQKDLNQTLSAIYRGIGEKLDIMSPGTKALQGRYANMLAADQATKAAIERSLKRNVLFNLSTMGGGGLAGLAAPGATPEERVRNVVLGMAIPKLMGTTAAKSMIGKSLAKDTNALRAILPALFKGGTQFAQGMTGATSDIERKRATGQTKRRPGETLDQYLARMKTL